MLNIFNKKQKSWADLVEDFKTDSKGALKAGVQLQKLATSKNVPELYSLLSYDPKSVDFFGGIVAVPLIRLEGTKALPKLLEALKLGTDNNDDCDLFQTLIVQLVELEPNDSKTQLKNLDQDKYKEEILWISEFIDKALEEII